MECLTNQERMYRLLNREHIDRIPMCTNASIFSGVFAQLNSEDFFGNMQQMYDSQKYTRMLFGCHGKPAFCFPNWIAVSLGCKIEFRDSQKGIMIPQIYPIIRNEKEAEKFKIPDNPHSKVLSLRKEFINISRKENGKVSLNAGSVMEIVAQITEISLLLRWMAREPELIFHLCDVVYDYLIQLIKKDINTYGADNCMAAFFYPLESKDLVSEKMVRKFSWPYIIKMHKELKNMGIQNFHEHLCGDQSGNLELFKDLKLPTRTCFSIDEKNDILNTAAALGGDYIIEGNVSSNILLAGTMQDVVNHCEKVIKDGKQVEGGFILSPSCDLPPYTPPLNLYAMHWAACEYGKY